MTDWSDAKVGCSTTVSATREQVKEACRDWARDMRWFTVDPGDNGPCLFYLNRANWMIRNPTIQVSVSENKHLTDVEFRGSLKFTNPPFWDSDLTALAESFAHGVCSELARQGATVEPASFGLSGKDRARQKAIARVLVSLFYTSFVGFVPVGALIGIVSQHALLGFTVGGWLALCYMTVALARYRTAGMRARVVLFCFVIPCLIPVLVLTIASAVSY
jgi:hypothetical protein